MQIIKILFCSSLSQWTIYHSINRNNLFPHNYTVTTEYKQARAELKLATNCYDQDKDKSWKKNEQYKNNLWTSHRAISREDVMNKSKISELYRIWHWHFFGKKLLFFWHHTFRHQNSHLWNTIVTSVEHNCHIFGTQLSHLWNATCCPCREVSDYNTMAVLITTLWPF